MALPNIRPLPEHLQKVANEELNERPERLPVDLQALKSWAEKEPHLNVRLDDQLLVGFLRGCKFSLEKAKSKIDWFYTLKTKFPDFFTIPDVDEPSVVERLRYNVGCLLPIPLHETGPRIMFIRAGNYPADKYTFKEIMNVAYAQQELWIREDDYATVNGFIDVVDVSRLTAAHFSQHSPNVMKKLLVFAEQAMPLRWRATHFINIPAGFDKLLNMLKPLMPTKQQERVHLHGNNFESLYAHVPQQYLPKQYGGENGCLDEINDLSTQFLLDKRDYFIEDQKYRNNEKLRLGKQPNFESIFGMDGSFRKLDVD